MTIIACGPDALLSHFKQRLGRFSETPIFSSELAPSTLAELSTGDILLVVPPPSTKAAQQLAAQARHLQLRWVEISTCDSPWATQHGFLLNVAGLADDLLAASPLLDALAPINKGWWHIGHAGAASFFNQLQQFALLNPLNQESRQAAPALKISAQLHQSCLDYLNLTRAEIFTSCHPERQKALASFLDEQQSPARQLAFLISLLPHE